MTYTLVPDTPGHSVSYVQRDEDGALIPFDPDNTDYVEYLRWLDEGNEPTAYTPPAAPAPDHPQPFHYAGLTHR